MLRHEGAERSDRHNQALAGYLALVAGFVNSAGFVTIGFFTSHVTGNVGRLADDTAARSGTAVGAAVLIVAYFAGAFLASMAIESNAIGRKSVIYGGLLLAEACLLATFVVTAYRSVNAPRSHELLGVFLCIAMGLQNSLVTRLSGAVVRTTHLTGVVTDLGIESARWFRLWRARIGERTRVRLVVGRGAAPLPQHAKTILLLTILVGFIAGSLVGALLAARVGSIAFAVPIVALITGGVVSIASERTAAHIVLSPGSKETP